MQTQTLNGNLVVKKKQHHQHPLFYLHSQWSICVAIALVILNLKKKIVKGDEFIQMYLRGY